MKAPCAPVNDSDTMLPSNTAIYVTRNTLDESQALCDKASTLTHLKVDRMYLPDARTQQLEYC